MTSRHSARASVVLPCASDRTARDALFSAVRKSADGLLHQVWRHLVGHMRTKSGRVGPWARSTAGTAAKNAYLPRVGGERRINEIEGHHLDEE